MRRDFITDDSGKNILFVRKSEVFFRGYIAEHRRSVPPDLSSSDRAGDVVITRSDIGDEGP
jgi:hypothetical protein